MLGHLVFYVFNVLMNIQAFMNSFFDEWHNIFFRPYGHKRFYSYKNTFELLTNFKYYRAVYLNGVTEQGKVYVEPYLCTFSDRVPSKIFLYTS